MSWIELDDGMLDHPKFIRAIKLGGSEALHLWLGLRAYCAKQLTDGFVPEDMIEEVKGPRDGRKRASALKALLAVNLLDPVDGGVMLHDYLDWSRSRAQIEESRRINNVRSALRASPQLMAAIKDRDGGACRYCSQTVDWKDRRGPLGGTYDHVIPLSRGGENHIDNIVIACRACNSRKHNRPDMKPRPLPGISVDSYQDPTGSPTGKDLVPLHSTPLHSTPLHSDPDPSSKAQAVAAETGRPISREESQEKAAAAAAAPESGTIKTAQKPVETQANSAVSEPRRTETTTSAAADLKKRAEDTLHDPTSANFIHGSPGNWPEVQRAAADFAAALGLRPPKLGGMRDAGVAAIVALFEAGYTPDELSLAAEAAKHEPWCQDPHAKRGLSSFSPEVVRRLLDAHSPGPGGRVDVSKLMAAVTGRAVVQ